MRAQRFALLSPLPLALLWALGCSSPKDNALFADDGLTSAAAGSAGGSAAAVAGTGSISGASQAAAGSSTGEAGSQAGGSSGGTGGTGGAGGVGGNATTSGGAGGGEPVKRIESCDMLEGAVTNEQNGHCYRVNSDKLTFAAARDACQVAAGHLVTLGDEAEDGFAHDLFDAAHWIGASDGRPDRMQGTGPFAWVDGEPMAYSHWEGGQPNAVATNCPDETSGAHCYEHCAFQTGDGAWNDRACFHTIASICEWDIDIQPGPASAGGAGSAR